MVCIVTFFIIVIASNQKRVYTPGMTLGARFVNSNAGSKVFASLFNVSTMLLLYFYYSSFLMKSVNFCEPQKMWRHI